MRIEVSHAVKNSQRVPPAPIRSGIVNCAKPFSDVFYATTDLVDQNVDVLIMNGGGTDVNLYLDIIKKNGGKKPKGWDKVLFLQCLPFYKLNNPKLLDKIARCKFDGFLTWDKVTRHMFDIFGVPSIMVHIPYDVKHYRKYKDVKKKGKMILNVKNLNDEYIGMPTLIKIVQEVQNDIEVYLTTNPAYPQYVEDLNKIKKIFKLKMNVFEPSNHWGYIEKVQDFKIFLSADERLNAARFTVDAGLIGSISIAPGNSIQRELFPRYIMDKNNIDQTIRWIKNWRCLTIPENDMRQFSHVAFEREIRTFVKEKL